MNWRLFFTDIDAEAEGTRSTPRPAAWGVLALLALGVLQMLIGVGSGSLGWLFLGAVQTAVILATQTRRLPAWPSTTDLQPVVDGVRDVGAGTKQFAAATWRMIVRCVWCGGVGVAAGLLLLGWFTFQQPELWRYGTLRSEGPPLGAMVVTIGTALLIMQVGLWLTKPRKDSTP